jgi:SAM-dependent methyltransferase
LNEVHIEQFWEAHPCGDSQVGGLDERYRGDYERFFADYDSFHYSYEAHILDCLDRLDLRGKRLLEIGPGEGAEAEQLIRRGAVYSALDLTAEAVNRTTTRLVLRNLPFDRIEHGSALAIPWPDRTFQVVFAHGVLHHIPNIQRAQQEIHRVVSRNGELVVMLYARWSLNYLVSIGLIRRASLTLAYPLRSHLRGRMLAAHLCNAEREGLIEYLRMKRFVHANTDGPDNPYSKVYDLSRVHADFPSFEIIGYWQAFMHAPPLPVHRLPGGNRIGWHLWVRMRPR